MLAQAEVARARDHAITAGASAKMARQAYEHILEQPQIASAAAGKAAVAELKEEAMLQAKEAVKKRNGWEDMMRELALNGGEAAADVYRKALDRDMKIAFQWEKRVGQLETGAYQRDMLALTKTAQSEYLRVTALGNPIKEEIARATAVQARRSEDEANMFRMKAADARKMSSEIRAKVPMYAAEERQAAASTVWSLLPPGIAPPIVILATTYYPTAVYPLAAPGPAPMGMIFGAEEAEAAGAPPPGLAPAAAEPVASAPAPAQNMSM